MFPKIWRKFSLSQQFLVASAVSIVVAMAIVGTWLSSRIEGAISQHSAIDAALYVESVVGERIQGLAEDRSFNASVQKELEQLVLKTPLGRRIVSFKVWVKGGRVIYANRTEHVGKTYTPTERLKKAWAGTIEFEFNVLVDQEDVVEHNLNMPLLEIYVPVRKRFGGEVIAIVEFYEDATDLLAEISTAKRDAWLLLAAIGLAVVAALYGMARRASKTIDIQRAALTDRISDLSRLLAQNSALRERVEASSRRTSELNERYLRQLGADLHDGPAQLISVSLFRLDALRSGDPAEAGAKAEIEEKAKIRQALHGALKEIREISIGLSVPELDKRSLTECIEEAIRAHEYRADCHVRRHIGNLATGFVSRDVKLTVYRMLQEALNNCAHHARGAQISVTAKSDAEGWIEIEVADCGPGFDVARLSNSDRLGIIGMRERIECVGGSLEIRSAAGAGTRLVARLPVAVGGELGA